MRKIQPKPMVLVLPPPISLAHYLTTWSETQIVGVYSHGRVVPDTTILPWQQIEFDWLRLVAGW